jgi:murein L,D-transpeptidase YafK
MRCLQIKFVPAYALVCLIPLLVLFGPPAEAEAGDTWLLIDTEQLTLSVYNGERKIQEFEHISIGRGGAGRDRVKGDRQTPLGSYRVAWLNPNSRFHFFIGLDYPKRAQVERAFKNGDIDADERERILNALYHAKVPPQNTALGGRIGIHGLGNGDPRLHAMANWTDGCVALTNEQIDRLRANVRIGMPVVIQ